MAHLRLQQRFGALDLSHAGRCRRRWEGDDLDDAGAAGVGHGQEGSVLSVLVEAQRGDGELGDAQLLFRLRRRRHNVPDLDDTAGQSQSRD